MARRGVREVAGDAVTEVVPNASSGCRAQESVVKLCVGVRATTCVIAHGQEAEAEVDFIFRRVALLREASRFKACGRCGRSGSDSMEATAMYTGATNVLRGVSGEGRAPDDHVMIYSCDEQRCCQ